MDKEFKDPENPFRIAFVCAMWLTGFDVKSLSVIYIDKPLKAHTLMQTIARANRVYEGKSNGLIVDYVGVVKALRKALADYTKTQGDAEKPDPAPDKGKLIERIVQLTEDIFEHMYLYGFDLAKLVRAVDFDKLASVLKGANAMCISEEVKKRFEVMARELFKLHKYVDRKEIKEPYGAYKEAIQEVYNQLQKQVRRADNTELMIQLHNIVSEYIKVEKAPGTIMENASESIAESRRFDISRIDFERLQQEFARVKSGNLLMKDLKDLIDARLDNMLKRNPMRVNYYERYQAIIEEYNAEQDKAAIEKAFIDLTNFMKDLDDEEKRYVREGFENDEELAMYDLLLMESLTPTEIKKVKSLAKVLLERIKNKISKLDRWTEKEETKAEVDVMIRDLLWSELPISYDDNLVNDYRQKIYEFVYTTYPAA